MTNTFPPWTRRPNFFQITKEDGGDLHMLSSGQPIHHTFYLQVWPDKLNPLVWASLKSDVTKKTKTSFPLALIAT
jgi:hypothetical protein